MQIGLTGEEAEDIVNQHKHYYPSLIVQLNISRALMRSERCSEKDLQPELLNAKNKNSYCSLLKESEITAENIVSIYAMTFYRNSTRFNFDYVDQFWPEDFVYQNSKSNNNSIKVSSSSSFYQPFNQTNFENDIDNDEFLAKLSLS